MTAVDPHNLALVIHAMDGGGAQRMMALLARHWSQRHHVTLITLAPTSDDVFALPPNVRRIGLDLLEDSSGLLDALRLNRRRVGSLRQAFRDAQASHVVSFVDQTNVLSLLAAGRLRIDVVIAERTDPRHHALHPAWSLIRRWTYPRCRAAVAQTEAVRAWLQGVVRGRPVRVIPNPAPVVAARRPETIEEESSPRFVVAMGRLSAEKGVDLLIDAFSRIAGQHPDWHLCILGEGPERARLQSLGARLLPNRIEWCGWVRDVDQVLRKCELFVLSSRYEGFPNALLEAMACGLPVISTDCDSGPREIVRPEIDGLLVPPDDPLALADALNRCMSDTSLRRQMGHNARSVTERFSEERFLQQWDDVVFGS